MPTGHFLMPVRVLRGWFNFLSPEVCQSVQVCHAYNLKTAFLQKVCYRSLCQIPVSSGVDEAVHPVYERYP